MSEFYDKDYFEHGIETKKSFYQNYRWMPELTMPMAMTIIDLFMISKYHTILDFGCAKGYLVKAFRLLHRKAWGVDISEYAINNADSDIKNHCFLEYETSPIAKILFDFCIAKDVLEHIPYDKIVFVLKNIKALNLFAIIPLGKDKEFFAPSNNMDLSHVICEEETWWRNIFEMAGWELKSFDYKIKGIKDSYYKEYPNAHGFFAFKKKKMENKYVQQ